MYFVFLHTSMYARNRCKVALHVETRNEHVKTGIKSERNMIWGRMRNKETEITRIYTYIHTYTHTHVAAMETTRLLRSCPRVSRKRPAIVRDETIPFVLPYRGILSQYAPERSMRAHPFATLANAASLKRE